MRVDVATAGIAHDEVTAGAVVGQSQRRATLRDKGGVAWQDLERGQRAAAADAVLGQRADHLQVRQERGHPAVAAGRRLAVGGEPFVEGVNAQEGVDLGHCVAEARVLQTGIQALLVDLKSGVR